jgi:hypothetical protein
LWCTFCLLYFFLNCHSSTEINGFQSI